ncbi:hypothetical protein HOU66_gp05 [Pectobacterium phage Arno160]|uniref:Uncharacterized protein n=1 Tax=Pectobacterium phage Arno160 TaxID=2488835 RepID=A0A3G8F1W1_9CAUD|nr:hypothetical protein HOU66_gp05 [Pectobacterium phage Arno160]AZF88067.1 hypothetical protein Arno160_gp05 [Pectobacterium phage Arno160]
MSLSGVASTKGHLAGNGGLRGHSVGGVFPCVIFQRGMHSPMYWVLQPNGVESGPHVAYADAVSSAKSYNEGQL